MINIYYFYLRIALVILSFLLPFSSIADGYVDYQNSFEYNDFKVETKDIHNDGILKAWGSSENQEDLTQGNGAENPKTFNDIDVIPVEDTLCFVLLMTGVYTYVKYRNKLYFSFRNKNNKTNKL